MKGKSLIWIAGGMALLSIMSLVAFMTYQPPKPPPPFYGQAPDFELIDQNGLTFSSDQLKGRIWVADFFFVNCPGPCPKMSAHMRQLNVAFKNNKDVVMVSITVDPERDSPEALKRYGKRLQAFWDTWHFLTGSSEAIHKLSVSGFKLGDPESLIRHSTKFVLIDRDGRVRGYFEGTDLSAIDQLRKTIKQLL